MNKRHKWYNEIVAWADGAEIEWKNEIGEYWDKCDETPMWNEDTQYRIKPQPKEPQYLYVYKAMGEEVIIESKPSVYCGDCIGKIKLEVDYD